MQVPGGIYTIEYLWSPDQNQTEHLWDIVIRSIRRRQELTNAITQIWVDMTQSVLSLGACIQAREGHTRYWEALSCRNLTSLPHHLLLDFQGVDKTKPCRLKTVTHIFIKRCSFLSFQPTDTCELKPYRCCSVTRAQREQITNPHRAPVLPPRITAL